MCLSRACMRVAVWSTTRAGAPRTCTQNCDRQLIGQLFHHLPRQTHRQTVCVAVPVYNRRVFQIAVRLRSVVDGSRNAIFCQRSQVGRSRFHFLPLKLVVHSAKRRDISSVGRQRERRRRARAGQYNHGSVGVLVPTPRTWSVDGHYCLAAADGVRRAPRGHDERVELDRQRRRRRRLPGAAR